MSSFDDKFESRNGSIYNFHGDTAIALDEDSVLINASCLVLVDKDLQTYSEAGIDVAGVEAVVSVRKSEIPIRPFKDHRFLVGSTTYHVDDVFRDNGIEYTMTVKS